MLVLVIRKLGGGPNLGMGRAILRGLVGTYQLIKHPIPTNELEK